MNYVLNFCRITSASRIFSRNFYLPLLKPTTPKDALRTFRITGRWLLGAKTQHYIPVLLNHAEKRRRLDQRRLRRHRQQQQHRGDNSHRFGAAASKKHSFDRRQKVRKQQRQHRPQSPKRILGEQEEEAIELKRNIGDGGGGGGGGDNVAVACLEATIDSIAPVTWQRCEHLNGAHIESDNKSDHDIVDDELHEPIGDYDYFIPRFDADNDAHRLLLSVLASKPNPPDGYYAYTVDDRRCTVVLSGQFERAVRDGDVIDVMVSQRGDKLAVKLSNFKKITLPLDRYDGDATRLLSGEGATTVEEEKCHHHGKFIMSIAKIFEDKEREAEEWELELRRIVEKRIKRAYEASKEYNDILQWNTSALDWRKHEKDCKRVIEQINEPIVEHHIGMIVQDLDITKDVAVKIQRAKLLHSLPTIAEIPDIVSSMSNATYREIDASPSPSPSPATATTDYDANINPIEAAIAREKKKKDHRRLSGVQLTLSNGKERFVAGQMIHTDDGSDVFVPGQTVENEFGVEYAPGITVNLDNQVTLVNGIIVGNGIDSAMFCPTDSTITEDGNLSFATTPEERIKYKPIRAPKCKKDQDVEAAASEEMKNESALIAREVKEPETSQKKIKRKKRKEKLKVNDKVDDAAVNEEQQQSATDPFLETIIFLEEPQTGHGHQHNGNEQQDEDDKQTKGDHDLQEQAVAEIDEVRRRRDSASLSRDQRQELERLRKELLDDGLDEIVAGLEAKSSSLRQKLEELRKIKTYMYQRPDDEDAIVTYATAQSAREHALRMLETVDCRTVTDSAVLAMSKGTGNDAPLDSATVTTLTETLLDLTRRCCALRRNNNSNNPKSVIKRANVTNNTSFRADEARLKVALKESLVAADDVLALKPRDQLAAMAAIADTIAGRLVADTTLLERIEATCAHAYDRADTIDLITRELTADPDTNKYEIYRKLSELQLESNDHDDRVFDAIEKLLDGCGELTACALKRLARSSMCENVPSDLVKALRRKPIERFRTEQSIVDYVQTVVVAVVRGTLDRQYEELLTQSTDQSYERTGLTEITAEARGLSRLLERHDVDAALSGIDPINTCKTTGAIDAMKRVLLLRRLSAGDPVRKCAIDSLRSTTPIASSNATDTALRDMIRESAVLAVTDTSATPLISSRDVPIKYLREDGVALEDYLLRRRVYERPLMICKKGVETVVPRESRRAVADGRIEYVLIDERGRGRVKRTLRALEALKLRSGAKKTDNKIDNRNRAQQGKDYYNHRPMYRTTTAGGGRSVTSGNGINETRRQTMSTARNAA